jgi:hypothetical protein
MNIFVLNSGRCGSTSFIKACKHIRNFTASHESRACFTGKERLNYPTNHIEADNRLCWFLGRLDKKYGNKAFYIHLSRERQSCAESFVKRSTFGIMKAYKEGILLGGQNQQNREIALDYLDTIESNITLFLKDKTHQSIFRLEQAQSDFRNFWQKIGAEGDLQKALAEWQISYNASNSLHRS